MYDDAYTRNDNDELAVRTVSTSGDNGTNKDDVFTRDNEGRLAMRTVGGDQHNLGYFATQAALEEAHPTAEAGDWAIVGSTDTVWIWDTDTSAWKDSDQKGQVTSVNNQTGAVTLTASDVGAATTAQGVKADTAVQPADLATVATTGDYGDLLNKPTIPSAQVNSDWNANSGVAQILNKPTIPDTVQYSTMPTASADNLDKIVQFTGTTDANYTSGYFYKCVSDGQNPATYSWTQVDVQPSSGGSYLPLSGGTLTGDVSLDGQTAILFDGGNRGYIRPSNLAYQTDVGYKDGSSYINIFSLDFGSGAILPSANASYHKLGSSSFKWGSVYVTKINNGADIAVPTTGGTMAVIGVNTTATLAVADWSSNTQTVSVNGVTSTSVVFVAPDPSDAADYAAAGILCTSQGTNSLTFTATTTPTNDIDVNIVCL